MVHPIYWEYQGKQDTLNHPCRNLELAHEGDKEQAQRVHTRVQIELQVELD
jgi:hypothetical protein